MNRLGLAQGVGWGLAFAASWFAWAWLNLGFLPIAALAGALALDATLWNKAEGHRTAAWAGAATLAALLIGFSPDWLVLGALGVTLAVKLRAISVGQG